MSALDDCTAEARVLTSLSRSHVARLDELLARDHRRSQPPERLVLVVDDEPASRMSLVSLLTSRGIDTVAVATVREARVAVSRHRPAVVLCDYLLAGETAPDLLRSLDRRHAAVIVSGVVGDERIRVIARDCGAAFVPRPETPEQLDALVAMLLRLLPPGGTA